MSGSGQLSTTIYYVSKRELVQEWNLEQKHRMFNNGKRTFEYLTLELLSSCCNLTAGHILQHNISNFVEIRVKLKHT